MKIAVLGCGTVGGGVVDLLIKGVEGLQLVKILDKKECFVKERIELYTDNINDILNDKGIDTVVETMGGMDFSYFCIKNALLSGKNVVTANKEVIAVHLKELQKIADEKGVYLMFEASSGGGIPVIKPLSNLTQFNEIKSIYGILNGTTNYILTKMQDEAMTFEQALKEAQRLGFAERDPKNDVEGLDMVRKIAILSMIAFGQEISIDSIFNYPISSVSKKFIEHINKLGYKLKYLSFAEKRDGVIEIGVEPCLVKIGSIFASVNYENNVVQIDMNPNDKLTFIGKGAGKYPTASAIISDLRTIASKGESVLFCDINNFKIGLTDKSIDAVVDDGENIVTLNAVSASTVRKGGYKFYARILNN